MLHDVTWGFGRCFLFLILTLLLSWIPYPPEVGWDHVICKHHKSWRRILQYSSSLINFLCQHLRDSGYSGHRSVLPLNGLSAGQVKAQRQPHIERQATNAWPQSLAWDIGFVDLAYQVFFPGCYHSHVEFNPWVRCDGMLDWLCSSETSEPPTGHLNYQKTRLSDAFTWISFYLSFFSYSYK